MIPQGIIQQLLAQQQAGQQQGQTPQQNPGALLGGQMPQAPAAGAQMQGHPMMPQQAGAAPQGQMPQGQPMPAQGQQGAAMPNMTPGAANAISTGLNTAMQSQPGGAQGMGLTSQGVMQALGGGMGQGMNPQLMQILRQGIGNGTA